MRVLTNFSTSSPALAIFFLFNCHLVGYEVVSCCGFDLYFPIIYDTKHLYMCFLLFALSLEKCLFRSFAPYIILLFGFVLLFISVFWILGCFVYAESLAVAYEFWNQFVHFCKKDSWNFHRHYIELSFTLRL